MLDSNTILGIRGYLECEEYEHGLLTQNNDAWPCGTPVVYPANMLNKDRRLSHSGRVYTLMSPNQNSPGVEVVQAHFDAISPVGLKPLYNNHKVLTVSRFDIDKFDRLLEFIRDVGGISLIIEYEEGRTDAAKSIRELGRFFKYSSVFFYNTWSNKVLYGKDDNFACVLTFLDIPYCVPLFNMSKVDGIGLSFSGATRKASLDNGYLNRIFRADFIYSNYEENIFFMDGIAVNSLRPPDERIYDELSARASLRLEIGKPDKKTGGYRLKAPSLMSDIDQKIKAPSHKWTISTANFVGNPVEEEVEVAGDSSDDDAPELAGFDEVTTPPDFSPDNTSFYHNGSPVVPQTEMEQQINNPTAEETIWEFNSEPDSLVVSLNNEDTEPEEGGN